MLLDQKAYVDNLNMHSFLPVERVSFKQLQSSYLMNIANWSYRCHELSCQVHALCVASRQ